jgi:hypothetical protein
MVVYSNFVVQKQLPSQAFWQHMSSVSVVDEMFVFWGLCILLA